MERRILMNSFLFFIIGSYSTLFANLNPKSTGLLPQTEQELKYFLEHQATGVMPNKIGVARMMQELEKRGQSMEIAVVSSLDEEFLRSSQSASSFTAALPSAVNNSQLPYFPPVMSQDGSGACASFAIGYYQATHEIGLARGFNNKITNIHRISPLWCYNLVNFGHDRGSSAWANFQVVSQNGGVTIDKIPFNDGSPRNNVLGWDTNLQDWISAMSFRTTTPLSMNANTVPQDLSHIKQALANGHVLTFQTCIESWQFTTIHANSMTQNLHVGELACSWQSGVQGGHMLTVVGYDDNVWIDVNQNGQVDPGEVGAFLICNSWGTDWGNQGFMWVSYDAFRSTSAVVNGPTQNRAPIAVNGILFSITAKAPHYKPSLIGEFGIGQIYRDQIKISGGVSTSSATSPASLFLSGALDYQGGALDFWGASIPSEYVNAVFPLDFTDLVVSGTPQRFYFVISDQAMPDDPLATPTMIQSLTLKDLKHNHTYKMDSPPTSVNNAVVMPYIDYTFPKRSLSETSEELHVQWTSPAPHESAHGFVPLVVSVNEPAASVEFRIGHHSLGIHNSPPYIQFLNTHHYPNGNYELFAITRPKQGKSVTNTLSITIANPS